jgi:hypothetical protein
MALRRPRIYQGDPECLGSCYDLRRRPTLLHRLPVLGHRDEDHHVHYHQRVQLQAGRGGGGSGQVQYGDRAPPMHEGGEGEGPRVACDCFEGLKSLS